MLCHPFIHFHVIWVTLVILVIRVIWIIRVIQVMWVIIIIFNVATNKLTDEHTTSGPTGLLRRHITFALDLGSHPFHYSELSVSSAEVCGELTFCKQLCILSMRI